jgi:glucosamine--fructose-6-phosphate aminotransferase (isomerizing)
MIDSNFKCLLRAVKKDDDAVKKLSLQEFPDSHVGMAHTRWATSGRKTINNAHPHVSSDGKIAVVHNGIIENYVSLKKELKEWEFHSETDTEVISNFLARSISSGNSMMEALEEANQKLEGTWAIVVMCKDYPDSVFVSRNGNPLLVGFNTQNNDIMISSEVSGFVNQVDTYSILEDNQFLEIKRNIKPNLTFQKVPAEIIHLTPGDFPHFMAKEIYDQTEAIYGPCQWNKYKKIKDIPELQQLKPLKESVKDIDLILIGCGTSFHSCLSSKWFFNKIRSVKCVVASEFTKREEL